jgi:hypothetical protein
MNDLQKLKKPNSLASLVERNILQDLLADKKSSNTRRTYAKSLQYFFQNAKWEMKP